MDLTTNSYGQALSGSYTLAGRVRGGDVLSASAHRVFNFDADPNSLSDDDLDEAVARALTDDTASGATKREAAIVVINSKRKCLDADRQVATLDALRERQVSDFVTPRAAGITAAALVSTVGGVAIAHTLGAFASLAAACNLAVILLLLVGVVVAMLSSQWLKAEAPRDAVLEKKIEAAEREAELARRAHVQAWERLAACYASACPATPDRFDKT